MTKALDEIGRLFGEGTVAGLTDGQLLERFASRGDGEAFGAIVARHGPLVLSACRSALGRRDRSEAEDAFQATFIILARRAGSFPLHGSLAGWLYRVARRVARQARLGASRRRSREQVAAGRGRSDPPHDPALEEVRDLVRQEVARLPERYRAPILMCDLHGLTRDEAAEAIGCPPGTVAGRLARARELLRGRLARRGVSAPTLAGLAVVDPPALFRAAARAAVASARGEAVSVASARLAARASGGWLGARVPGGLGSLAALAAAGVAVVALAIAAGNPVDPPKTPPLPPPPPVAAIPPAAKDKPPAPVDPDDPAVADLFAGQVVDADGKPLAGARVYLIAHALDDYHTIPANAGAVRAVAGADGRFRFSAKDMTYTSIDGLPARRPGLLIAAAEGYGPAWQWTWTPREHPTITGEGPQRVAEWTLTLPRDDVPIRGRLLGPGGLPLAGATVKLHDLFLPRVKDLGAELAKGGDPQQHFFTSLDGMGYHSLHPGDAAMFPGVTGEAVTDADGRFRLAGPGRDRLAWLTVLGTGVVDTRVQVLTREMPEIRTAYDFGPEIVTHGADFTLALKPGRTLTGVVRDMATGRPLPDVPVGIDNDESLRSVLGRPPLTTDAQGRFSIGGVSPDPREAPSIYAIPGPGRPNFVGKAQPGEAGVAVVDCPAGIPFRLTLRDEAGRPAEAEVVYSAIHPNEAFNRLFWSKNVGEAKLSRAARQADGSYLGVALPGPGVVLAKLPPGVPFRPAHVDPKGFFAPGKVDWTPQDLISTYGNLDSLSILYGAGPSVDFQEDYAAIVLVNPPEGSKPLDLDATVHPPRPRMVTLVDPEGRPVVGARSRGITFYWADNEPRLRSATFPLTKLHPDRTRRITFLEEGRKLIGFLMPRGDGDSPYVVTMQPWAAVIGRLVDEQGRPMVIDGPGGGNPGPAILGSNTVSPTVTVDDPRIGLFPWNTTGVDGRFRIEQLVPGQVYSASFSLGPNEPGRGGTLLDRATFAPGEVRDLGDIRARPKSKAPAAPTDAATPPGP